MRFLMLMAVALTFAALQNAHASTCGDLIVEDALVPVYAPIARAAHIQGVVRFDVYVDTAGNSTIKLLDGQRFLAGAAEAYLAARRHRWATVGEHTPCSYVAALEYRLIPSESDSTNNFRRVTILGAEYTLIEAQNQKPTCSDCASDECPPMDGATEPDHLVYPPIARAAHVSGEVSARIEFDQHGEPTIVDQFLGPEMLKATTEEYLKSWRLNPLPSYMKSCHSSILIEYRLTASTEVVQSDTKVFKADPTHILVEDHPVLLVDPASTVTKKKKFMIF